MENNQSLPDWVEQHSYVLKPKWVGDKILVLNKDSETGFLSLGLYDDSGEGEVDDYAGRFSQKLNQQEEKEQFFKAVFQRITTVADFFGERKKVRDQVGQLLNSPSNTKH
jgi:hypothetical protein